MKCFVIAPTCDWFLLEKIHSLKARTIEPLSINGLEPGYFYLLGGIIKREVL